MPPRPRRKARGRGWRCRSWAYFGLSFGGFGAPMIAMTVPTFSAVTSRKFGGQHQRLAGFGPKAAAGEPADAPEAGPGWGPSPLA
jgi:hypothetical protein